MEVESRVLYKYSKAIHHSRWAHSQYKEFQRKGEKRLALLHKAVSVISFDRITREGVDR